MEEPTDPLKRAAGFEWDEGNIDKSWKRHGVRWSECEEVFSRRPLLVARDDRHSQSEPRYAAWGRTSSSRRLVVVFTFRGSLIRVVSARDMSRAERREYEHAEKAEADPEVP